MFVDRLEDIAALKGVKLVQDPFCTKLENATFKWVPLRADKGYQTGPDQRRIARFIVPSSRRTIGAQLCGVVQSAGRMPLYQRGCS